jgi:hypothetical protein
MMTMMCLILSRKRTGWFDAAGVSVGVVAGAFAGGVSAARVSAARVAAGRGRVPSIALLGAAVGVLLVVEHAASKPNANRTMMNRTNVFILTPLGLVWAFTWAVADDGG